MEHLLSEIDTPRHTQWPIEKAFFLTPPQLCFCQTHESLSFLGLWYVFEHFRTAIGAVLPFPPFLVGRFVAGYCNQIVVGVNPRVGQHSRHFLGVHVATNAVPAFVELSFHDRDVAGAV
jgi:hypothetical protein